MVIRPHFNDYIQLSIELARETLRKSFDALKLPAPDTFLGRKTQEPFPKDYQAPPTEGWLTSKELGPPK